MDTATNIYRYPDSYMVDNRIGTLLQWDAFIFHTAR